VIQKQCFVCCFLAGFGQRSNIRPIFINININININYDALMSIITKTLHGHFAGLYVECSGRGCDGRGGRLRDGSPPAGSRGRAPVRVWGRSPQKL